MLIRHSKWLSNLKALHFSKKVEVEKVEIEI